MPDCFKAGSIFFTRLTGTRHPMPISTTLRKFLFCAPGRQEEDEAEAPARRPLPEPAEDQPAQAGRPYRGYVENEVDRMLQEMIVDLEVPAVDPEVPAERQKIPLPEHPAPHHPPIHFTIDPDSGRPIPDEDALIRADYVYVPEDGSRITRGEYIHPWRGPDARPIMDDLISRNWAACYSLHGVGAGRRLMYHWLTGPPGEAGITMRVDRLFSPVVTTMHFSPRPPVRDWLHAEAPARRPLPEPMEAAPEPAQAGPAQAGRPYRGYVENEVDRMFQETIDEIEMLAARARADVSAIQLVPEPARQPVQAPARQPVQAPARQVAHRAGTRRLEIPLPDHPEPRHPPIYYTLDPASGLAIPERDSYIRPGYVRRQSAYEDEVGNGFKPWRASKWPVQTDFRYIRRGVDYYTLESDNGEISILLHFIPGFPRLCDIRRRPLHKYLFSREISEEAAAARRRLEAQNHARIKF